MAQPDLTMRHQSDIAFDDMHDTGIYSWDTLHRLGSKGDELMAAYRKALAEQG